jgi:hypothetical protein
MELHGQVPPAILHYLITSQGCIAISSCTESGGGRAQLHFTHTIDSSLGAGPRKRRSFAALVLSLKWILQICNAIKLWAANQELMTISCFLCGSSECSTRNSDMFGLGADNTTSAAPCYFKCSYHRIGVPILLMAYFSHEIEAQSSGTAQGCTIEQCSLRGGILFQVCMNDRRRGRV